MSSITSLTICVELNNWAWWKVEVWETFIQAARRELEEETAIKLKEEDLKRKWIFHFYFMNKPEWDMNVTLFITENYIWSYEETEEMKPEWFNIEEIPYDKMWDDDKIWLPRIIDWAEEIEYNFSFDSDWKIAEYKQII